jgi:hypothetical protein
MNRSRKFADDELGLAGLWTQPGRRLSSVVDRIAQLSLEG